MATSALRLRRKTLSLSSFIFNHHSTPLFSSAPSLIPQSSPQNPNLDFPNFPSQFRAFRSSNVSFIRPRPSFNDEGKQQIGEEVILFEGCDYNHWLITMDFPKEENKPSAEEMVETYVQTAAKVLGSVEEAKRKIYACSTTTYHGFQVEVSEEVSKKFEGLPGVVFILPDSYIDPTNKEYGGDKYINGTIIPRPPPVHYGRGTGKFNDRNRDFNQTNRGRGEYQQGSQTYGNQGSMQGSPRDFAAPQNPRAQQNHGPPRVNERRVFAPNNNSPGGQDGYSGYRRDPVPPSQGYYNHDPRGNSYAQGQSVPPGQLTNNAPPQVGNSGQDPSYGQGAGAVSGLGAGAISEGNQGQGVVGGYGQGAGGGYAQGAGGGYSQGAGGGYSQGAGAGGGHSHVAGVNYRQVSGGGVPGHDKISNYGQSYSVHGENERLSQGEQMNDVRQVRQ